MSLPAPSVAQIRAQVAKLHSEGLDEPVIGIRTPLSVDLGDSLQIGEQVFSVWKCQSALDVRDHLASMTAKSPPAVLLTELTEPELGHDVVIRLARRKLIPIDPWALVKHRFQARYIDPRLVQQYPPWVPRVLLEAEPKDGYPPAPSGFLQAETVWRLLFEALLGLQGERDVQALLGWGIDPTRRARLAELSEELRDGLAKAVGEAAGSVAERVFRYLAGPNGGNALAVGLCARILYDRTAVSDPVAAKGQGKLEALLGGAELDADTALAWAEAAEAVVRRRLAEENTGSAAPLLSGADSLLASLSASACAHRSRFLRAGFEQRLTGFADELAAFVAGNAKHPPPALTAAAAAVRDHVLSDYDGAERAVRVDMAGRLAEWLAEQRALPTAKSASFGDAAKRYRREGGHVDWARSHIRDGDTVAAVSAAYAALAKAVDALREAQNADFGSAYVKWMASGSHDDAVLPVEKVLTRVVAPLAVASPVLLVVVDGMSVAVFRELDENLTRQRGWMELISEAALPRVPVVAAMPSVTEVCRASLLCGQLTAGAQGVEKQGFASHAGLVASSDSSRPPLLFHKGELVEAGAMGLAPAVRNAIADAKRRVVGVVINAVDDHLAKGEQVRVHWTADSIRPLWELVDSARNAGRALVLVSDHGHVIEHHSKRAAESESERWRPASPKAGEGEILVKGPRVVLGGGSIVVPWSERIRYAVQKKNGYHGGASPQEAVIPLAVYAPPGMTVTGWSEAEPEWPGWWERAEDVVATPAPKRPPAPKPVMPAKSGVQGSLFETAPAEAPAPGPPAVDWIEALLASEVMKSQRQSTARTALSDERIRVVLVALDERGGKLTRAALAKRLGVPVLRVNGVLSALRRLLNVDGYGVLSVDEESDTVSLNREYLDSQFGLK